jgi:NAD(P)-dependent dehydrogenase (short-subunit alcohol dehydrogenase family)
VSDVERRFGPVGVLVNNAGYGQYGPLEEITLKSLRKVSKRMYSGCCISHNLCCRACGDSDEVELSTISHRSLGA